MWYKAQKVKKYALNLQLQALQILTNNDEVENWGLSSFLLAVSAYLVSFQFQHSRNPFVNLASFVYQLRTFVSDVGTYSSFNKGFEMGIDK